MKYVKIKVKPKLLILFFVVFSAVAASVFINLPFGYSKIFPLQHFASMFLAVLLGPWYALAGAFSISLLRNVIGTGTIFAFPGSMIGAVLAGIFFMKAKKISYAFVGEVIGTGVIGAFIAYLIGLNMLAGEVVFMNIFTPFMLSTLFGGIMALSMFKLLEKNKEFGKYLK